jgi:hypothetical protein
MIQSFLMAVPVIGFAITAIALVASAYHLFSCTIARVHGTSC